MTPSALQSTSLYSCHENSSSPVTFGSAVRAQRANLYYHLALNYGPVMGAPELKTPKHLPPPPIASLPTESGNTVSQGMCCADEVECETVHVIVPVVCGLTWDNLLSCSYFFHFNFNFRHSSALDSENRKSLRPFVSELLS